MFQTRVVETLLIVSVSVVLGSFGQVFMKKGLTNMGGIKLTELLSPKLFAVISEPSTFAGLVFYVLATMLWFVALSGAQLSYVYPMIALGYVVTAALATHYFGEVVSSTRWFGIALILLGVFFVSRS